MQDEYSKALDHFETALQIFEEKDDLLWAGKCYHRAGQVYEKMGKDDEAIKWLFKSINTLEDMRGRMAVEEHKTGFMNKKEKTEIYETLINLLIKQNREEEAWNTLERVKARTFLDMLGNDKINFRAQDDSDLIKKEITLNDEISKQRALLQQEKNKQKRKSLYEHLKELKLEYELTLQELKASHPDYASLKVEPVSSLQDIRHVLEAQSLILEYFVATEKTYLFIVDVKSLQIIELPYGENSLRKMVGSLRKKIANKSATRAIETLSGTLLPPAALKAMAGKEELIIIPHSVLHYLPFCLLKDSQGDYLVKNYDLLTEPSASVWKQCLGRGKNPAGEPVAYALAEHKASFQGETTGSLRGSIALSSELMRQGLPPLPATRREVEAIASLYPQSTILTGSEMTKERVKETIRNKNVVHFATHGILDGAHPTFSGLLLADSILTIADIFALDVDADLVVLSACNTGIGKRSNGDEIAGISRAFIYAGSPTVIASLWSVADESTAELMEYFFQELKKGSTEARALRLAQLKVMKNHPHPFHWAPFILIGESGEL